MTKTIILITSVLAIIYASYKTYQIMSLDKGLDKMITEGAVILDVRTETEYKMGHIEGAVNIPLSKLHADNIPLDKSKVIITCCSHGLRSVKAVSLLKANGFNKVYNGGAWTDLQKCMPTQTPD
ncbi:MAG: rhodanese-like domain-containing protein [Bacteroidota bacterium]